MSQALTSTQSTAQVSAEAPIRQLVTVVESAPAGASGLRWRRVAAIAVVHNPLAGQYEEDLSSLSTLGGRIAGALVQALSALADPAEAVALGRVGAVGLDGEVEHAAALIGPAFVAVTSEALFATVASPPSTRVRLKAGGAIDVTFQARQGAGSASATQIWKLTVDGHPRDDEALVVLALCSAP